MIAEKRKFFFSLFASMIRLSYHDEQQDKQLSSGGSCCHFRSVRSFRCF